MELPDIPLEKRHICIVGAGPAGLASAKEVLESAQYRTGLWEVTVFESRSQLGGVWLPAPAIDNPPLTPMYDALTTNLPHSVMQYDSFEFPPETAVFPSACVVETYLQSFSTHFQITPHIQFNTTVSQIEWDPETARWNVQLSSGTTSKFDFVMVANGHYRVPRFPDTAGLSQWLSVGKARHSAWYRRPEYMGDTVLVVGAGPSGNDISCDIRKVTPTVIRSISNAAAEDKEGGKLKIRGRVLEFRRDGQVLFENGVTETVDYCIMATGYQFAFPFIPTSVMNIGQPPPAPPLPSKICNSSFHIFPLARHIFPLQATFPVSSLAFIGLPIRLAPFPVMEAQARAALHEFANPGTLNTPAEAVDIMTRYEDIRSACGDDANAIGKAWHVFKDGEQFEYRDALHEFAASDVRVPESTKLFYEHKDLLRAVWLEMVQSGEADEYVKGVGNNGPHEWVDLLKRMLRRGGIDVEETTTARL